MVLSFRPLTRDDFGLVGQWLAEPHVRMWWHHDPSPAAVERDFGPAVDGAEPTEMFAVLVDGEPIGLVQRYLVGSYPEYVQVLEPCDGVPVAGSASIDYLIGDPGRTGQGLGTALVGAMTDRVLDDWPHVTAMVVPVQQDNVASWRALERAGYRRAWSGLLDSDDPSDQGPSHVLVLERPAGGGDGTAPRHP